MTAEDLRNEAYLARTRKVRKNAAILTAAQEAMRKIVTEADALVWLETHYYPGMLVEALRDEFKAMHRAVVSRVHGAGGG